MGTEVENGSGVAAGTARLDKKKDWGAVPVTAKWGRAQVWTDAAASLRFLSAPTQTRLKFGPDLDRNG